MFKILKILFGLNLMIVFLSCEGGTTFTKTVVNDSSETITLKVYSSSQSPDITILPNETQDIWADDVMGRFAGPDYSCVAELDSIQVSVSNNKVLTLNLMDNANWTRSSKNGRNAREDCSITISDEDLQ